MLYPYITYDDGTQIVFSELRPDLTVRVVVERPRDWGFDAAECVLPSQTWTHVDGFSEADMAELRDLMRTNAPLIMRLAGEKVALSA